MHSYRKKAHTLFFKSFAVIELSPLFAGLSHLVFSLCIKTRIFQIRGQQKPQARMMLMLTLDLKRTLINPNITYERWKDCRIYEKKYTLNFRNISASQNSLPSSFFLFYAEQNILKIKKKQQHCFS